MMFESKFNSVNEIPADNSVSPDHDITVEEAQYLDVDFGKNVEPNNDNLDIVEASEPIPSGLIPTESLKESLDSVDLETIYQWYVDAISRRDREPIGKEAFMHHFFEGGAWEPTYVKGDMEKGFVLGFYKYGIFIPTHFAPRSIRTGYELFKELGEETELSVITTVTDDIAKTLLKMNGWHKLNTNFLSYFNSDLKKKILVYNNVHGVRGKLVQLVKQFWDETKL